MNERFKELGQKAGLYVDLKGDPWPKWMSAEECEQAYKKFAELIILECAGLVENQGKFLRYDSMASKIKENFGIKK